MEPHKQLLEMRFASTRTKRRIPLKLFLDVTSACQQRTRREPIRAEHNSVSWKLRACVAPPRAIPVPSGRWFRFLRTSTSKAKRSAIRAKVSIFLLFGSWKLLEIAPPRAIPRRTAIGSRLLGTSKSLAQRTLVRVDKQSKCHVIGHDACMKEAA